ncbi:MAG TPA: imidazolonepropionase [Candidatus Kapabacteria bacterium]|nr:imidazolonepropionase [Candidatus Kapabacteria bacterium]
MATLLLENIATLVTVRAPESSGARAPVMPHRAGSEMADIGVLHGVDVAIDGELIEWIGPHGERSFKGVERMDCGGRTVLPGFVDSHTHMVFAGDRSDEFARRLRGASYQEIAAAGGGILSTVRAVREASLEDVVRRGRALVGSAFRHGSTTIEVKSGYGLDTASEIKLLEAIRAIDEREPAELVATFLGAHDMPPEHRDDREAYVREIIAEMIPRVASDRLAVFCDVFSDTGYFTVEESERIYSAALEHGLRIKVHADELSSFGGAEMAARVGAISADHLLQISDEGIARMRESGVVATLLPGTAFFLNLPYAPARRMIGEGMAVALATDCNPGSNMCENMQMTLALACMGMRMTVEEAITASTLNGAAALGMSDRLGSIEVGKQADMAVFDVPDYPAIVYHYGVNQVSAVVKKGALFATA